MRQMWYSHILCLSLSPPLQPSGKGPRLPEVYCVISRLGCFGLFSKVRDANFLPIPVTALIGVSADSLDEKNSCVRETTYRASTGGLSEFCIPKPGLLPSWLAFPQLLG